MSEKVTRYLQQLTQSLTDINPLLEIYENMDELEEKEVKCLYYAVLMYQNGFKYSAITLIKTNLEHNRALKAIDILLTTTTKKGIIETE